MNIENQKKPNVKGVRGIIQLSDGSHDIQINENVFVSSNGALHATTWPGAQGAQGPQGQTMELLGTQGQTGTNVGLPPVNVDNQFQAGGGTRYSVATTNQYLPSGDYRNTVNNHLPVQCTKFNYVEINADMTSVGLSNNYTVFIPCYYN
jgi:hypothetical protein